METIEPNCLFPRDDAECREWTTILSAARIEYRVVRDAYGSIIHLQASQVEAARREIATVTEQNENWPPPQAPVPEPNLVNRVPWTPFVMVAALGGLYAWLGPYTDASPVLRAGLSSAEAFRDGEWWRVVTALGIHGDAGHLAGNLVFVGLLGWFVCQRLGDGLGGLLILLSGAGGNLVMATLSGSHYSVGASTATFGALGIVIGAAFAYYMRRESLRSIWSRAWIPLGVAAALFGWTGVGEVYYDLVDMPRPDPDDTTDIGAHFFGLLVGMALGAPFGWFERLRIPAWVQGALGLVAVLLFATAWRMAIKHALG